MWQVTGAIIHRMSAVEHDDVFAAVSHLPHLLAFALVDMLAGMPRATNIQLRRQRLSRFHPHRRRFRRRCGVTSAQPIA